MREMEGLTGTTRKGERFPVTIRRTPIEGETMMKVVKVVIIAIVVLYALLAVGESGSGTSSRAEAAARVYPIVDTAYGFLLGGTSGGDWISTDVMSNTVAEGETYRVYSLKGYLGRAVGSSAPSAGAPCE